MSKTVKRISVVICILLFNIMMVYNTGYVYAEAPQDQNFDSVAAGSSSGTYQVGDLNFTTDTGIINVRGWDALSYEFGYGRTINGFSGMAISNDPDLNTSPKFFAFESTIQRTFKLQSLYALITDMGSSTKVDIKGYNGSSERVHVDGIDFTKPGTTEYGDVTYTNNVCNSTDGEYGGFLFFGDSWYDINRVVITDTNTDQPLYISLDSLDFSNFTDLSIADAPETTEGQNATFSLNLTKKYSQPITVNYSIIPDTATADDLGTTENTVIIPAETFSVDIKVPTKDDNDYEKAESFKVKILNTSVGGITDGEATCTIKDNDSPPKVSLSIDKSSISENGGTAKIIVDLSNKTYEDVKVNLGFTGATPGTDFIAPSSITIPASSNSLSASVDIIPMDNDIFSGDKSVTVGISTVEYGEKDTTTSDTLAITDDETEPKVNLIITPGSISENGTDTATVKATLTNKSSKDVTVKLSFGAGAVKDKDFTVSNDTITIHSTDTEGSVQIKGIPNNKFNNDKTFTVSTSDVDVINATTGNDKSKDLTITNIDAKPTVTVAPVTPEFNENDPATMATFTVSLSQASDEVVTVDFTTSDGSAKSTEDYTSTSGPLTIPKGSLSGEIKVPIKNDSLDEIDEDFTLTINNPVGADLGTSTAKCTIKDDDDPPEIVVVPNTEVTEGDSEQSTKLVFEVKLSAASGKTVTVKYSTAGGTATSDIDYKAITDKTLTFTPGETGPKPIEVTVIGDDIQEPSETVTLNLSADNANNTTYTATGTITDNDTATMSINDALVTEGPSQNIVFKVSLSKPCSEGVSVKFRTKDGSAVMGEDYVQQEGTVTFAIGESGDKTVTIGVKDDELYEGTETFSVELYEISDTSVEKGKITGTGTINDNESIPKISVETIPVEEGNTGTTTTATFKVSVSPASAKDIYVDYATSDGTAKAGKDYTAITPDTLLIPAKQDSKEINVDVTGDTIYEDNETFSLILSNPSSGAEIDSSKGTAVCTINDDDSAPSVTFDQNKVKVDEGDSGTTPMVFNVTLSAKCEKTVSIDYVTEDGTATIADNDYTPLSDKLEFAPGETTKQITVSVIGDKNNEPEENFYLILKDKTGDIKAKAEIVIPKNDKAIIKVFKDKDSSEIINGKSINFEGKENEIKFKISNMGNSELVLETPYITINGTNKSDFSVKSEPVSPIAANDSTTFIILFNPSSPGVKTAEISITGKDTVNSPFTFKVSGGTVPDSQTGGDTTPQTPKETIDINVGDQSLKKIAVDVKNENNIKTTTVNLDETEVQKTLNEMEKTNPDKEKKVVIPVTNNSDKVVGELKASTLKAMADMDTVLEIKTENASYSLPANDINIDEVVKKLGGNPELKDISVKVTVTKASDDTSEKLKEAAANKGFEVKGKPVEFEISFTNAGRKVTVSSFNNYVARTVAIPEGMDHKKITTGVVYNPDGSFTHVPTAVNVIDNIYYAQINSLTNSTYALIYNPLTFKDVEKHWSKDYVNDAGSRLIVSGTGNGNFTPDRAVTRAEFAVMIVKALGLKGSEFADNFSDVGKDNPYYSYICTAYQYGIITGYNNGKFGPNDLITREQSMTMISKAMKIAGMDTTLTNVDNLNKNFSDSADISKWAKDGAAICVNSGLFVGNKGMLNPKNNVTRAESATVIIKLLKNAHLI